MMQSTYQCGYYFMLVLWPHESTFPGERKIHSPCMSRSLGPTLKLNKKKEEKRREEETGFIPCPSLGVSERLTNSFPFYLPPEDLVHTIGESASQGAAGVILWGSENYSCSQEACLHVKKYVDTLLGHYIVNVTSSARLCSQVVCFSHGRCMRQDSHPEAFLHLSPASFTIKRHPAKPRFIVTGHMAKEELVKMKEEFRCRCYSGWEGPRCNKKSHWDQ